MAGLAAATLLACSTSPDGGGPPGNTPDGPDVVVDPRDEVEVTPPLPSSGREWRRMDIDQLAASTRRVSGGLTWTELDSRGQPYDVFESLSGSLGKPDFLNSNTEELEPTLLFQKFLDDGANAVCDAWVTRERNQPRSQRILVGQAEFSDTPVSGPAAQAAIAANMRAALLRFHGKSVEPGDPQLAPWIELFRKVWMLDTSTGNAWRTVCVALFIHPDFYTF